MKTVESDVYGRRLGKRLLGYGAWLSLLMATACDVHEFPEDGPPAPPAAEEPVCVIDLHFLTGDMPLSRRSCMDRRRRAACSPVEM